jgi:hypothetical protein
MKNLYYVRIPLWVKSHTSHGVIMPRSVYYNKKDYKISRVLSIGDVPMMQFGRPVVKYVVLISGMEKALYYDVWKNRWYSLKEVSAKKAQEINSRMRQSCPYEYFRNIMKAGQYLPSPKPK